MKQQKDIFISYRRAGGEWFAYCIFLELLAAGYSVFFDVECLRGGDFEKDIEEQILSCKDFILVLPPDALRRCAEADDLVYKEIKTAKNAGKNIIPIMMKGFSIPSQNIFIENNCPERYQDMKYIEGRNGYITDGILNLDGTMLHLQKNLLTAIPNFVAKQKKSLYLENVFTECDAGKNIRRPEYELLPNLSTNEYFVEGSRDKEIAWLSDAIERIQPVFVWGYGGVGKTELVLEFARYHSRHRNVAFVTFSNSIRETIIQMKFAGYSMPDLKQLSKEEREVAEEKIYQEKLRLLNSYSEDDILIVDNFEKAGKTIAELKSESAYKELVSIRMHVIFTTRNRPDKYTKEIRSLKNEDLLSMMKHYLGSTYVSDNLLLQLIDAVDSHTMAVELIAKLLNDEFSSITPQEILNAFAGGKVKELDDAEIESYKDREYKETTIFEYIKKLFDLTVLSDNEMEVLRHAFFISPLGMDAKVFTEIGRALCEEDSFLGEETYAKVAGRVVNKGWLRIKDGKVFIHSLVKELMWEEGRMKTDESLENYLINFIAPQFNPVWCLEERGLSHKDWENTEKMRAEYMACVFRFYQNADSYYAAAAAEAYGRCGEFEQAVIYSHYALDILIQKRKNEKKPKDFNEYMTLSLLHEMWCPNMVESSWDPDYCYGNELYEDHSDKPDEIQGIYQKILLLHNNNKKR